MRRSTKLAVLGALVAAVLVTGHDGATAAPAPAPGTLGVGPTARYIDAAHRLFLDRPASDGEILRWAHAVHADDRLSLTTALAASDEWAGERVDELYQRVLGREADPDGRSHWVGRIRGGLRLEDVAAVFHGSEERWRALGSDAGAYVDSLYRVVLEREPDAGGRAHWSHQVRRGTDRTLVAAHFLASLESRRQRVDARYQEVLDRAADPGGREHWTGRLAQLGDVVLAAHLAASAEFHQRATGVLPPRIQVVAVGPGTAYPLTGSWRSGCPVHHRDLAAVEFPHWTDDGGRRSGVLIVHRALVPHVAHVARTMFGTAFPLTSARPVDDFGGDDDRSMAADNSSAFNCRTVAGTSTWSEHAYGRAIDLNPERNPYVRGGSVEPPSGRDWLDRSDVRPGMLVEGSPVVAAFDRLGWGWGGRWSSARDYQHFSTTGR